MANGQGNQLAHGYPGTPVGDLFPPGANVLLGSGAQSSLRPIRAGELRAHSACSNSKPKSAANSRIVVLCAPKSAAISRP